MQPSPDSSSGFARAWTIRPERSRLLAAWHVAVHALAGASLLLSGISGALQIAGAAAVLAHGVLRRPRPPLAICRLPDGTWAVPGLGLHGLAPAAGTAVGPFWIRLRLGAPGAATSVLLLVDQLDRESWRRLKADLRRRVAGGMV